MTLANIVRQKLSETPAADARHELMAIDEAGGWSVHVTAERRDKWSTVAWEVSLRRAGPGGDVGAWATRVAEMTNGLLEALHVVEVDAPNRQALLRSDPPTEQGDKIAYYEVILRETSSALVRRFEGTHTSGKRDQVPFVLTNEVLAKFIADLASE
jgi:hypothetical protein